MKPLNYTQLCTSEPLSEEDIKKLSDKEKGILASGGIMVQLPHDITRAFYIHGAQEDNLPIPRILYLEGSEKAPFYSGQTVTVDLDSVISIPLNDRFSWMKDASYIPEGGYEFEDIVPDESVDFSAFGLERGVLSGNQVGNKSFMFSCNESKNAHHTDESGERGFLDDHMALTIRVGQKARHGSIKNHRASIHLGENTYLDIYMPHTPRFVEKKERYIGELGFNLVELPEGMAKVMKVPTGYQALVNYLLGE